ncbi:MAG: ABC transporter substrate-binding protein [Pseudomonadota bacterium]
MKTIRLLLAGAALCAALLPGALAQPALKVLRYAFPVAETGFDPAQISDLYSRTVTPHIFESLYGYDHLARPAKIVPLTAAAMPSVSEDFRTWTVRIQPGIYFTDDPAFKGRRRELVAEDYVYTFKRIADPKIKAAGWPEIEEFQFLGLSELREEALKGKKPFNYDREIEGLKSLDRYTIQFKMKQPRPRLIEKLASADLYGAVAREVVEHYGDRIMEHPVGTGPFKLAQWRRSSFIALDRNPAYRERYYDAQPAPDDAEGQALLQRFKGRRIPMIDRVEISIIEESQPRWLAFLNRQLDFIAIPLDFVPIAVPNGKLAPHLRKQGIQAHRMLNPDSVVTMFNMEDPVVGGYAPEKVALRRAIGLGFDTGRMIQSLYRGQAVPAQGPIVPGATGYDPGFKSENGDHDPARANALLDLYGYLDRDGDGWRDMPDGSPLVLKKATQPEQLSRQQDELWKRDMTALKIRIDMVPAKWPENLKAARAGKLQMWSVGSSADVPDGQSALARWYGPAAGTQNLARFKSQRFDAIYERMQLLADGPERMKLFHEAKRITVAWMPWKVHVHRILNDLTQPWLVGYRRAPFWQEWWHMVDVEPHAPPAGR